MENLSLFSFLLFSNSFSFSCSPSAWHTIVNQAESIGKMSTALQEEMIIRGRGGQMIERGDGFKEQRARAVYATLPTRLVSLVCSLR